jgi:hypothetical protein
MMQPPVTGRTGNAPRPPVGPPGAGAGEGVSVGLALAAEVPGVGVICSAPTTAAPHPTIKTNRPAPARRTTFDLPMFVIVQL